MTATPAPVIKVTLELKSLGGIPEHSAELNTPRDFDAFLDGGGADMPLPLQVLAFGKDNVKSMLHDEFSSWLDDLGAKPANIQVTFENV